MFNQVNTKYSSSVIYSGIILYIYKMNIKSVDEILEVETLCKTCRIILEIEIFSLEKKKKNVLVVRVTIESEFDADRMTARHRYILTTLCKIHLYIFLLLFFLQLIFYINTKPTPSQFFFPSKKKKEK